MNNLFHKTWDDLQMSERSELYLLYVGKEVIKRSSKPFKNGQAINIVKDIVY